MITAYCPPECYTCICRACGQRGCPHRNYLYKRCEMCWRAAKFRPILSCKNFYLKQHPRYRIKRVYKSPQIRYVDKTNADDIRVMLSEILNLLKSGSSPVTDVNCVRNDCLCLSCEYFRSCSDRCRLCKNYKGEHPVKMCAQKIIRDKGLNW